MFYLRGTLTALSEQVEAIIKIKNPMAVRFRTYAN